MLNVYQLMTHLLYLTVTHLQLLSGCNLFPEKNIKEKDIPSKNTGYDFDVYAIQNFKS